MTNDEPLMDDETLGDSVLRYFDEHPELVSDLEPAHDLWPDIEARIQARVLPLSASARSGDATVVPIRASHRRLAWLQMTAAAAALVVATAGVTYVLTRRAALQPGSAPAVATTTPTSPSAITSEPAATTSPDDGSRVASNTPSNTPSNTSSNVSSNVSTASSTPRSPAPRDRALRSNVQLASTAEPSQRDEVRSDYDREITTLRAALDARRTQLDPATVRTVEQNLNVIDHAIRQAKAALAKDPRSRFLNDQLDRSLAKKTDLLRAAALLPSA